MMAAKRKSDTNNTRHMLTNANLVQMQQRLALTATKDEIIHRDNCMSYVKFQKLELESELASVKSEFSKYVSEIPKDGQLFPFMKEIVRTNIIYINHEH